MVHVMSEVDKYSELKLVAGKATPGPWWVDSHGMNMTSLPNLEVVFSHPANGDAVRNAETGNLSHWRNDWDASYIATANPKTILELISDFDAQRLRADTAEAELGGVQYKLEVMTADRDALCARLDAAERRIVELTVLLKRAEPLVRRNEFQRAIDVADEMRAALNPNPEAESQ